MRPTHDEIIRKLTRDVTVLEERLETVRREISSLPELNVKMALMEQQLKHMQQGWEQWLQRAWMILAPIVGGVTGALLTYLLRANR